MKEHHFNRSKISTLIRFRDFQAMEKLYKEKSKLPEYARPELAASYKLKKNANLLTALVVDYLKLHDYFVERTGNQGQYNEKLKMWTKGQGMRGTSDLKAVIHGKMVAIEIKYGNDKQSEAQIKYQKKIENAGGTYIIVSNMNDLIDAINLKL